MPADVHTRQGPGHNSETLAWALPLLVAGGSFVLLAKLLAGALVLPLFSLLLLTSGFLLATALLIAGCRTHKVSNAAWVVAGALVFLGFSAALLSDGHESLAELERLEARGVKAASN
jgi:hypothetical protein